MTTAVTLSPKAADLYEEMKRQEGRLTLRRLVEVAEHEAVWSDLVPKQSAVLYFPSQGSGDAESVRAARKNLCEAAKELELAGFITAARIGSYERVFMLA